MLNEVATKKELNSASAANTRANQSANAVFRNTEVLQAMGMVEPLKKMWLTEHGAVLASQATASDRAGAIIAATKFFRIFLQTIVLGTGAYLVINGELSGGGIIAGSIFVGRAMQPIEMAVGNWKGFVAARTAYARLQSLFKITGEEPVRMSLPRPRGAVQVCDVIAAAPGKPQPIILKGITCEMAPGEVIGIIGPSAAGNLLSLGCLSAFGRPCEEPYASTAMILLIGTPSNLVATSDIYLRTWSFSRAAWPKILRGSKMATPGLFSRPRGLQGVTISFNDWPKVTIRRSEKQDILYPVASAKEWLWPGHFMDSRVLSFSTNPTLISTRREKKRCCKRFNNSKRSKQRS